MLLYRTNSWHYQLILYVWTKNFFIDSNEIDWKAMHQIDSTKLKEMSWGDFPKIKKAKTVNFCPYCRALVAAVITLPFIWIWRQFPHKPKPQRTHAEIIKASEKRSRTVRYCVAAAFTGYAVYNIIHSDFIMAAIYFLLALFNIKSPEILKWTSMQLSKIKLPKRKHKVSKPKKQKKPSELAKKIHEKHDLICPPVFFVDAQDAESLR